MFLDGTTDIAKTVLAKRYLTKSPDGKIIETEKDMYWRVASTVGKDEPADIKDIYFGMLTSKMFMPNTPCLINAGKARQQMSACFVLPIEDSIDGIMDTAKDAAIIHASGGGTGFSFSKLRPDGDLVSSSSGVTPGPIAFLKMYDAITGTISQGGTRRGANLAALRVDHPDILKFIDCKKDGTTTNFNLSVSITDEFMKAVKLGADYNLVNPRDGSVKMTIPARKVWASIVDSAWSCGDPGILFIDTINRGNEGKYIEATNPCGEQPLPPYGACVLGHINLNHYVNLSKDEKAQVVYYGVRFLDDVIDHNYYPLQAIEDEVKSTRRIGLGIMGWADVLAKAKIPYGSDESLVMANAIMKEIHDLAFDASSKLAKEKGAIIDGRRNLTMLTIAPTGTVSIICNSSSGIEPYFALAFERHILDGTKSFEVVKPIEDWLKAEGIYENGVKEICDNGGRLTEELIYKYWGGDGTPYNPFPTAMEIPYYQHIKMQAAFQNNIDNAVSKTINLSSDATKQNVSNAYMLAYDLGCKGVTVFRDGCKGGIQVLNLVKKDA